MKIAVKRSPIAIHPASMSDAAIIRALAQRIQPVCFAGFIAPDQIDNMVERIYSIVSLHRQMDEGQRFWISYSDDFPVGYVSAYREEGSIWLKKLYCDPAFQGQGIGTAMSEVAIAAFMPASDVRLLVNRDNVSAQAYYERSGFTRIGEIPVMMGDFPFIDYLYSKPITEK